jgi:hypothetical protein
LGVVDVYFIVTRWAQRDAILDSIITWDNVMYLDAVQVSAYAAMPSTIGQQLRSLCLVKPHISSSVYSANNEFSGFPAGTAG